MPNPMRSWMFVPGNVERFLNKIPQSRADCIFLDLEDGVLPPAKEEARSSVGAVLASRGVSRPAHFVRVNAIDTPWFSEDLAAVAVRGVDGICVPKVEEAETIGQISNLLQQYEKERGLEEGGIAIVAAIESARGLLRAEHIAGSDSRVVGLMFGAEDFALDMGLGTHRKGEAAELLHARSMLVLCAASFHLHSIDGVFPDLEDSSGLEADVVQARRLGFSGKSTFNPRQVELINDVFSPQADEIEYARRVADAFNEAERNGEASVAVGGQLVDLPILKRAQRILELVETEEL